MKFKGFLIIFFILAGLYFNYVIFNDHGYIKVQELESKRASLIADNGKIENEIRDLSRKVSRMKDDPKYIEHIIRNEFNMVSEDEILIYIKH